MACGDRYRMLIATAEGRTPDDKCGPYCNDADHASWNEAAKSLERAVRSMHASYVALGGADPMVIGAYIEYTTSMLLLVEPSGFVMPGGQSERVDNVIAKMQFGVCVLEQLEDGVIAFGGKPPKVPGPTPPSASNVGWWVFGIGSVVVAVGATVGYVIYQRRAEDGGAKNGTKTKTKPKPKPKSALQAYRERA